MRAFLPVLGLALIITPACQAQQPDLGWMEGAWRSTGEGPVSEEVWSDDAGGLMLGTNRTIANGRAVAFEFLRIELASDTARYCAQPGGQPAVCFTMTEIEGSRVRFENPEHDFPQVIAYQRDGDTLTATISDLSGEQAMSFSWQAVER